MQDDDDKELPPTVVTTHRVEVLSLADAPESLKSLVDEAKNVGQDGARVSITIDGKSYSSIDDVPLEFRHLVDDIDGNGIPDFVEAILTRPANQKAVTNPTSAQLLHHGRNEETGGGELGPPPRTLTPHMEKFAKGSGFQTNPAVALGLVSVFGMAALYESAFLSNGSHLWLGMYVAFPLLIVGGVRGLNYRNYRNLAEVLRSGEVRTAHVLSNVVDWSTLQNQQPQRVVEYVIDNVHRRVGTFGGIVTHLPVGDVEVLYHPRHPKKPISVGYLQRELTRIERVEDVLRAARPAGKLGKIVLVFSGIVWTSVVVLAIAFKLGWLTVPPAWLPQ